MCFWPLQGWFQVKLTNTDFTHSLFTCTYSTSICWLLAVLARGNVEKQNESSPQAQSGKASDVLIQSLFFFNLFSAHNLRNHTFCEGLKQEDLYIHCIDSMSSVLDDLHLFVVEQNGSGSLCYIWCSCARFFCQLNFFPLLLNLALQIQLLLYCVVVFFLRSCVGHSLFT